METQILGKQIEDATIVPSKISVNPADNFVFPGSVSIGAAPVASAVLQADSTTKGFLAPRMTTTQRNLIASPATGLTIYNTTTNQPEVYNGTIWTSMGGGTPGGATTQIQYNNAGVFAGDANLTWVGTTQTIGVAGTGSAYLTIQNGGVSGSWGVFRSVGQDYIALGFNGVPTNTSNSIFYKTAVGSVTLAATDAFGITITDGGYGGGVAVSELYAITSGVTPIGRTTAPFGNIITKGSLVLQQTGAGTTSITISAPTSVTAYSLIMPSAQGAANTVITNNGSGTLTWANPGTGTITQSVYTVGTASGTYTGSTTLFNLPFAYVQDAKSLQVMYNGQVMISGLDYAETSTTSVTFTSALVVGGKVVLRSITPSIPANTSVAQYQNYVVGTASGPYTGSTTVYAIPFAYTQDGKSLWVYYDGVRLTPGDDYTETTTTSITTTTPLVVGRKIAFSTISAAGTAAAVTNLRENYVVGTASGSYTGSTTVFTLTNSYTPGGINLAVFLDGDLQTVGASVDYLETSGTVVTFNNALIVGQKVTFLFSQSVAAAGTVSSATSGQIAYYPSTGSTVTGSPVASVSANGVDINGSLGTAIVTTVASAYTALASDYTILGNAASNTITVNLPTAASSTRRIYVIKKTDSSANAVTVDANGSETIDGVLTYVLSSQWQTVTIHSNGTTWYVL